MSGSGLEQGRTQTSGVRAIISIVLPPLFAFAVSFAVSAFWSIEALSEQAAMALFLGAIGVSSLLLGLRWYGLAGLGLRGGRALAAGIGFASLIWIVFLLLRFVFVEIEPSALEERPPGAGRTFVYLLLFESLATQLWTYGLLFRSVADWRGPLTSAVVTGALFGLVAALFFAESFVSSVSSAAYFLTWGMLYGIVRLRTGSLLGTVVGQVMQTFTAWVVLAPYPDPDPSQLNNLYLAATVANMIIAWRLWPKRESDYRV